VRTDCPFTAALESIALKCWFVRTLAAGATKIETATGEAAKRLNTWKPFCPLGRIAVPLGALARFLASSRNREQRGDI